MNHPFARLRRLVAAALLAPAMILAALPATAQEASGKSYLFVLGAGDMPSAGAALHLAITAAKSGRSADVVLLSTAVDLALDGADGPDFAAYAASGPDMLQQALDAGARVAVCQICLANTGREADDLIDKAAVVNAFDVMDLAEGADVVLSFAGALPDSGITTDTIDFPAPPPPPAAIAPPPGGLEACNPATDIDGCM